MGKPKQITRKDLIVAAKKQLLQKGQGKITLKNVAESAGVTQGVVYYHFKTKDQLLISLLQDFLEGLQKELEENRTLDRFIKEKAYKSQIGAEQNQLLFDLASLALHQREMKTIMSKGLQQRITAISQLVGGSEQQGRLLTALIDGLAFQALFDPSFKEKESYDLVREWFKENGAE